MVEVLRLLGLNSVTNGKDYLWLVRFVTVVMNEMDLMRSRLFWLVILRALSLYDD